MFCKKCLGRVFIDRAFSSNGNIELSCTKCGKHWELHYSTSMARILCKLERRRILGFIHEKIVFSQ
jgi:hypothetical protein